MDQETTNTTPPQTEQPQAQTQAVPTADSTAQTPAPTAVIPCKCPTISAGEWDKKRQKINKTFHKTFSPRIFYYPLSFVIDVDRATRGALKKGYKPVDGGMVLDTGGMFWGSVLVEVAGANAQDSSVVPFENKEVYTKVVTRPWSEIKVAMGELQQELGAAPLEIYTWWTSCPKCVANKEVKAVLIAVTAQTMPTAQTTQTTQATTPEAANPATLTPPPAQPAVAPQEPAAQAPAESQEPAAQAPAESQEPLAQAPEQSQPPVQTVQPTSQTQPSPEESEPASEPQSPVQPVQPTTAPPQNPTTTL